MDFQVKPRFDRGSGAVFFETEQVNALLRTEYQDNFGAYQNAYGVYSYMQMTEDMEYRIHYAQGAPVLWQPHNSCAWTPTQTLSMATDTIAPCKVKVNEQYCYDEFLNSIYKEFVTWQGGGPTVSLSQAGEAASEELARTIVANATMGARITLTAGQLHDLSAVDFAEGTPTRIEQAFTNTVGACRGWIELCRVLSLQAGYEHLEAGYIDAADISSDGKTYLGTTNTATELYDLYVAGAKGPLADAVTTGGISGFGPVFYPIWLVSPSIHNAVYRDWIAQKETATQNEPRISIETIQVPTPRGNRQLRVYMIDNTVVIPVTEVSMWEKYLDQTSHFAYLTISGTIQLGGSFANLPNYQPDGARVAVMMQVSTNAEDYGTHKFLSHGLMATAINDTDYITGDYLIATPA